VTAEVLERIAAQRVVPVIRSSDADDAIATSRACARAGMRVVELTRTTPDVERALHSLRKDDLLLGLGTVTQAGQVRPAAAAGARFVVSFAVVDRMIEVAGELGVTPIPGALTPTEILRCLHAGAPAVKIFPARLVEPAYLSDLRAVMPSLSALVTGGVPATGDGMRPWLAAGGLAVGIGSGLGTVASLGEEEVERRARTLLDIVAGVPA
jgi:2-dehydro-3-deoxyphosphogluconate aldolase / (4S)-4-hydroxy-2-oxoglutarate aldolase